jgi:hypothetical protein
VRQRCTLRSSRPTGPVLNCVLRALSVRFSSQLS